jgi:hypothetical protein
MFISAWLKQRKSSGDFAGWALLVITLVWAGFRFVRSLQILFAGSHDLYTYYSLWYVMCHREMADIALRQSLYLPHTWLFLTPLFVFGWPVARILVLLLNLGCVGFLWWRLSALANLRGVRKALLLAFSLAWLSTGLVIGLGNLALVCVAAVVAAYPFQSAPNHVFLAFSAMKQTLGFPGFPAVAAPKTQGAHYSLQHLCSFGSSCLDLGTSYSVGSHHHGPRRLVCCGFLDSVRSHLPAPNPGAVHVQSLVDWPT